MRRLCGLLGRACTRPGECGGVRHEELLAAHRGPDGRGDPDVITYFKADPPGAYDRAYIHGRIWVPVPDYPVYPRDWPDWKRIA